MPSKPNGFMTFVQQWRQTNSEGKDLTLVQAVTHCGDLWQKMTKLERSPYDEEAKKARQLQGENGQIAKMDQAQREAKERQEEMERRTKNFVMEAIEANNLENAKFVFVCFNIFTKTLSGDMYVPAEFSACELSLKQGIVSEYSTLINPGRLDLGQGHDAQHHSSTTHNLPLPPNALGERNASALCSSIVEFLKRIHGCKPLRVFTLADQVHIVEKCFLYLANESKKHDLPIQVLALDNLLFTLKKQVLQLSGCPLDSTIYYKAIDYIQKDSYAFDDNLACKFHDDIDRSRYCSLSQVKRWAYSFCQYLCGDLKITLKPGKHFPPATKADLGVTSEKQVDSGSSCSSASFLEVEKYPHLAGFGRGQGRGRLPTLGEARR